MAERSKKTSSQQRAEQQRSRGSGQFDESKHPRSPIGQFADKSGGDRSAANRADFDRRVRVAEGERAKKAAGKGGGGGGKKGGAARPSPEQQRVQRRNESLMNKWGRTPGERERSFRRHVDLDLDMKPEELKVIEDELMRVHKVTRERLYDDLGLFEAVTKAVDEHEQERRAGARRGRAAETARRAQESAARAAERAALEARRKEGAARRDEELARRVREQRIRATGAPMPSNPRTFPVPASLSSAWLGAEATLDELDLVSRLPGDAGDWATRILNGDRDRIIASAIGDGLTLPRAVVVPIDEIDADVVVALITGRGVVAGAIPADLPTEVLSLDASEVGFALRAFQVEGASGVILSPSTPVAFLSVVDGAAITAAAEDLPPNAHLVAIVDDLDRNAVLDLIAVLPGPRVLRRHDGAWQEDDQWVSVLRGVRPPAVVEVTASLAPTVISQVDEATRGKPFEETVTGSAGPDDYEDLGGFVAAQMAIADDAALELLPIVAAQGRVRSGVYDVAGVMPPHLQRYWVAGPGAAKIRWGTPGAWRRCHRLLSKYMGPFKAKGACTNLGQKLGGKGVAWDVGGGARRAVARAVG